MVENSVDTIIADVVEISSAIIVNKNMIVREAL